MKTKHLNIVAVFAAFACSAVFAQGTVTLIQAIPQYEAIQSASVTTQIQSQSIQFTSTARLSAAAAPIPDTKSFTSETAVQDAQSYLAQTYCKASEIQSAVIKVQNEQATTTTALHPTTVTSVVASATERGSHHTRPINIRATCASENQE